MVLYSRFRCCTSSLGATDLLPVLLSCHSHEQGASRAGDHQGQHSKREEAIRVENETEQDLQKQECKVHVHFSTFTFFTGRKKKLNSYGEDSCSETGRSSATGKPNNCALIHQNAKEQRQQNGGLTKVARPEPHFTRATTFWRISTRAKKMQGAR